MGGLIFNMNLLMLHNRFASATIVLFCKYYRYKLENMKNKFNNTHKPSALSSS